MKKLILSAAVIAAAVFGVIKANEVNNNNNNMSTLQIENVEALGQHGEVSVDFYCVGSHYDCYYVDSRLTLKGIKRP